MDPAAGEMGGSTGSSASGELDRASGALYGLAVGDALGMPTQLMTRAQVVARYGSRLVRFEPAGADHPIAAGLAAGTVTDDTEQAVLLAELLVAGGGRVDPSDWARALAEWEADMVRRGSDDLLGPSTRRALRAVEAGVSPHEAGATGDTNGAAMRIAPVGVMMPVEDLGDLDALVAAVVEVSRVTHGTDVALAGACAVAAAVSAGVSGAGVTEACDLATTVCARAAALGRATGAPPLESLIRSAREVALAGPPDGAAEVIEGRIGTGLATVESVPAAFAVLAVHADDPWAACLTAASLGGDSDTIAAVVGAVAGACHGASRLPSEARELVASVNGLRLEPLAARLLELRRTHLPDPGEPP